MSEEVRERLSPSGEARREAMLSELTAAFRHTHRTRRRRRRALSIGAVGMAAVAVAVVWLRFGVFGIPHPDAPTVTVERAAQPGRRSPPVPERSRGRCVIVRVETDPEVRARFRARPWGRPARIDDDTLIATLAWLDRPSGLICYDGRIQLTAAVTDEDLRLHR